MAAILQREQWTYIITVPLSAPAVEEQRTNRLLSTGLLSKILHVHSSAESRQPCRSEAGDKRRTGRIRRTSCVKGNQAYAPRPITVAMTPVPHGPMPCTHSPPGHMPRRVADAGDIMGSGVRTHAGRLASLSHRSMICTPCSFPHTSLIFHAEDGMSLSTCMSFFFCSFGRGPKHQMTMQAPHRQPHTCVACHRRREARY